MSRDSKLPTVQQVQARLSDLPDHVARVDLLEFRASERDAPSDWSSLAGWALTLLEAIRQLRAPKTNDAWRGAPLALHDAPPVFAIGHERLDTIGPEALRAAQAWAQAERPDAPPCRDPAREQLAGLVEERLLDVVLEGAHVIRRSRRYPRVSPADNPLCPVVDPARGFLREEVHAELERFARLIGALPSDPARRAAPSA